MSSKSADQVIAETRALLSNLPSIPSSKERRSSRAPANGKQSLKAHRASTQNETFIWQNRPVKWTDWKTERDVTYVSIYLPTVLPVVNAEFKSIALHNHDVFTRCSIDKYCHLVGYNVSPLEHDEFYRVWGYLYGVEVKTVAKLNLGLL
jgi:hypothetical protein